jgi:hypothetical protein
VNAFRAKLEALGYAPASGQLPVTEQFVTELERAYGLRLPAEYRTFLQECGGWVGSATCEFIEQYTPFPSGAWIDMFSGRMVSEHEVYDVRWTTDSVGDAPSFVAVASGGANGCMVVVRCGGVDDGCVYFFDRDQRSLWADDQFRQMFPDLDPLIVKYLELRRAGQLPLKAEGSDVTWTQFTASWCDWNESVPSMCSSAHGALRRWRWIMTSRYYLRRRDCGAYEGKGMEWRVLNWHDESQTLNCLGV